MSAAMTSDRRNLMPPAPDDWQQAQIVRTERAPDGTWSAVLTMGFFDYWVRSYRIEDGTVHFQFQARRCADAEAAFLRYIDGLSGRMAG